MIYELLSFIAASASILAIGWLFWIIIYPLAKKTGAIKGEKNEKNTSNNDSTK